MKTHVFLLLVIIVAISSCKPSKKEQRMDALASHIDSSIKPGDDFFLFANGKWFRQHPIPASEVYTGFNQLMEELSNTQIRQICKSSAAIKDAQRGSANQMIGDFYSTGMDSVSRNKKGLSELSGDLARIEAIRDLRGIINFSAYIQSLGGSSLFDFGIGPDEKINCKNAAYFAQEGLSMPGRYYYFDTDLRSVSIRKKFISHVENVFISLGDSKNRARVDAEKLMKMETALAGSTRNVEDTRDPYLNYHKMTFKQFTELTPGIDWEFLLDGIGLRKVDSVIVRQPEFFASLNRVIRSYPVDSWKIYLTYHFITAMAHYADDKTYREFFHFYASTLNGTKEPWIRSKHVADQTNDALGELVGQVYVKEYLPQGTKEKLTEISNAIKNEFAERIKSLGWMSGTTKEKALNKLNAMRMKVGSPDKWRDLSTLKIDRSSYLKNVMNVYQWEYKYMISQYGKPVDRNEWRIYPQSFDAEYDPADNTVTVTGFNINIPGYEQKIADDAILYAIIGTTLGHEVTHGFDDQGCQYNAQGNLQNWWTPEDTMKFYARTETIIKQFNKYIAIDTLHINGELTQGENIADLGGLILAYDAFKKTTQYKNNEIVEGMKPSQRFFLGYAFSNMVDIRPEYAVCLAKSDEHSLPKFRVNGPISNMPEFYEAFGVKKGDSLWVPEDQRVKIW